MIWCGSGSRFEVWTARIRVEQVGEADPERLGRQPEQIAVGVEAPALARRLDLQASLVVPVEDLLLGLPIRRAIGQRAGLRAVPLELNDFHRLVGNHAADSGTGQKLFEG